jgi:hypothetical protein
VSGIDAPPLHEIAEERLAATEAFAVEAVAAVVEAEAAIGASTAEAEAAIGASTAEAGAAAAGVGAEEAEEAAAEDKEGVDEAAEMEARWRGRLKRTNPRNIPDTRMPPLTSRWGRAEDFLLDEPALAVERVAVLFEAVMNWPCARRVGLQVYMSPTFIKEAHRWNVCCQKQLTQAPEGHQIALLTTHRMLSSDVPERFRSAIGDKVKEINDMVNNHVGEIREIDGAWVRHGGVMPTPESHPHAYNCQYALNRSQYSQARKGAQGSVDPTQDPEGRYNLIFAAGDDGDGFKVRVCRICALAELLWFFGTDYTARELYSYYVNCRRLVLQRPHAWTNQERMRMVQAHYYSTGRWGLGCRRIGEDAV